MINSKIGIFTVETFIEHLRQFNQNSMIMVADSQGVFQRNIKIEQGGYHKNDLHPANPVLIQGIW